MAVNSELDELLSDDAPVVETPVQETAPTTTDTTVARDESGRFASKTAAAAEVEQPAQAGQEQPQPNGSGNVPLGAVQAEREKRQEAQQRATALETQLAELRGQVTLLTQQRQPATQPQQEKTPATLWDDPDAFLNSQLTPLQSTLQELREELWETKAAATHTPEALSAAKAAAEQLFGTPEGKALHQQLTSKGGNPFTNLVEWHKQQQAYARVGNDPDAWLQAEMDKRLSDPAEQAKILERIRNGAATNQNNGQAPLTNLPPSLSRIPASSNAAADDDVSDSALFSFAKR